MLHSCFTGWLRWCRGSAGPAKLIKCHLNISMPHRTLQDSLAQIQYHFNTYTCHLISMPASTVARALYSVSAFWTWHVVSGEKGTLTWIVVSLWFSSQLLVSCFTLCTVTVHNRLLNGIYPAKLLVEAENLSMWYGEIEQATESYLWK